MNIFFLDRNIRKCAAYHCDKHVVKMILESTQLLSTALHLNGLTDLNGLKDLKALKDVNKLTNGLIKNSNKESHDLIITKAYKPCHTKHPSTLWTASSPKHWLYLWYLCAALNEEYKFRYHDIAIDETTMENIFGKNEDRKIEEKVEKVTSIHQIHQIRNTSYDYDFHKRNLQYFSQFLQSHVQNNPQNHPQNNAQNYNYNHTSFNVAIEIFTEILHSSENFHHFIAAFTPAYNSTHNIYNSKYRSTYRSASDNYASNNYTSDNYASNNYQNIDGKSINPSNKQIDKNTSEIKKPHNTSELNNKIVPHNKTQNHNRTENPHNSLKNNDYSKNHDTDINQDTDPNFVDPPQAMPDQYKHDNAVIAYRNYYLGEKMEFAKWKKRNTPEWVKI